MNTQAVSLEAKANQIKEQGLKVFENETRMPMYGVPYASPFITIALTHQGWVKVNYDGSALEFGRHDMAIVPKGHVLMPLESSEDYCVTVVAISPQLFKEIATLQPNLHDHAEFHLNSVFHLNDEQFQGILGFIQMLHSISQLDLPERIILIANQMEIGATLIETYLEENGELLRRELSHAQQLLHRFQNAIVKHYRESREVQYYANLLCLSPKHFGSIIKQHSGKSANEWISQYVVVQAKSLLRYRSDLNIQQIAYQLGFADPAAFTRYFKTVARITPKAYREMRDKR